MRERNQSGADHGGAEGEDADFHASGLELLFDEMQREVQTLLKPAVGDIFDEDDFIGSHVQVLCKLFTNVHVLDLNGVQVAVSEGLFEYFVVINIDGVHQGTFFLGFALDFSNEFFIFLVI